MALEVRCLKAVVHSGSRRYPLFVGFMPAEQVAAIAEAPSFSETTSHRAIAQNVLEPPVKDWQRPLEDERVATIKNVFRDTGLLMPNPVLLSENGEDHSRVKLRQEVASGSITTDAWVVSIDDSSGDAKPLWILDGQHRINGLAGSKQKDNELPIVLLLNDDPKNPSYSGRDFANLFAQVTTTAKKLDELHNAWLTYAYNLEEYAEDHPDHDEHRAAMEAVAQLCRISELSDGQPNPFLNGVRFNPERPLSSSHGFAYGCSQLKEIIRRHYYRHASDPLDPDHLAQQLGLALRGLKSVVRAPHDESVFFGRSDFGQLPMQDGFVIGVLAALEAHGPQEDWTGLLRKLQFHLTDWKFRPWVKTTGGKAGSDSRAVAERVFTTVFETGELPTDVTNLADYLRGDMAGIRLEFSRLNSAGRPIKAGRQYLNLVRGNDKSLELEDHVHVRVNRTWKKSNIARIEIVDATSSVANPRKFPTLLTGGMVLDEHADERELVLAVYMHFYGGTGADAKLTLRW